MSIGESNFLETVLESAEILDVFRAFLRDIQGNLTAKQRRPIYSEFP